MTLHSRVKRINEELKAQISMVLMGELKDPRLSEAMVTVTHVSASKDLHAAQVYVSILGDEEQTKEAMAALKKSAGFIRHTVASLVNLRYMPELTFVLDKTGRNAANINTLLRKIERDTPGIFEEPPADPEAPVDPDAEIPPTSEPAED